MSSLMKKIYTLISMVALAALVFGCAKEIDTAQDEVLSLGDPAQVEEITVALNVPESPETKTVLGTKNGSSYPVKWSPGDGAYLSLNGTVAYESNKESDTRYTASFKPAAGLSVYNFLYRGDAGHDNQVTFPSTQNYVAGGFDPAAMPMYAASSSRSNTVTFSHLASLLKFSVTGAKKIVSVTLSAKESLSGTFTIGKTGDLLNGSLASASGGTALMYAFGSHIQLSSTPFVFYVAIPGGTYEDGITVDIVDNESGHMTLYVMTETDQQTIEAGKVREFASVAYDPATEVNLIQISDDATFKSFVSTVAGGTKTINARLTQNLSLSTSTINSFNSIVDYKGTFDGNGKTISGLTKPMFSDLKGVVKNLTLNSNISITDASDYNLGIFARQVIPSSEVDDIAGLQNCTASGSITFTPSGEVSGNACIGGLVGNNRGGAISGCTNNATVTFANNGSSTVHAMQPSIGGVVGRTQKGGDFSSQGDIYNCTNAGTVVCGAKFSQGIYLGGVLGYQVEKAESISGCTNSGTVKASSTCSTTGPLQIGGVIGMGKGSIESCSNLASQNPDVGVITEAGCSVGTYLCQGGVVGRLNRESDSYSGLSNAGTLYVAANGGSTARLIGGVVGRCNEGATITEFTNSGNINYTSTEALPTYIGGVVASNTTSGLSLVNCNSTGGILTYSGETVVGPVYMGGVVGYSTRPIESCTNAMAVEMGGSFTPTSSQYYCVAGIVGKVSSNATISNCLNTGNITYSQQIGWNGDNNNKYGYSFVGGVVGHTNGSIIDSSNGGTITITGKNAANNPFYGGLVGSTDSTNEHSITGKYSTASATNYGAVVINTTVQSSKYIYVGGVAGRLHTNGSMTATNAGPVTITKLTCTQVFIGGLAGLTNASSSTINSGSANLSGGVITITDLTGNGASSWSAYIGGVVGQAKGAVNANNAGNLAINGLKSKLNACIGGIAGWNSVDVSGNNSGNVVISSGTTFTKSVHIGGVVGHGEAPVSSSTNNGIVSNAAPMNDTGGYLQVGGVVGYNNTPCTITGCHNTGDVTNTANSKGYLYVGGVTSESDAEISGCTNTGDVSNSGNSGNGHPICVGGVAGVASAAVTSSSNGTNSLGGGTISNSGTSATVFNNDDKVPGIAIGGVAGINNGYTVTTCYNKGEVTNAGASPSSYIVVGGLVGLSKGGSSYSAPCYNTGSVSNTGLVGAKDLETPDNDKWVDVGGLIGLAFEANTLSGTSSVYNYNSGTVTENSESIKPYVGGVCGESDYAASDFTYCSNRSGGNITVKNNARRNITIGGVVGADWQSSTLTCTSNAGNIYVQDITGSNCINVGGVLGLTDGATLISGSDASHRTTNSGNIQFKTCTYSGAIRVGGILGCWDHKNNATIQYCANSGIISTYTTSTSSADLNATGGSYSGIGGVIGTTANYDAANKKTINDCVNTGNITIYSAGAFYLGGVAGCARGSISNCTNTATITYGKGSTTKKGKCMIGGVVGYGWNLGASGLYFNGTLDAHAADYSKETGVAGLVGEQNADSSFSSCKIGGTIWGGPDEGSTGAGLFICPNQSTKRSSSYSSCIIKTGTVIKYDTSTQTTINSTSDLTATNLHGRIGSSSSSTTGITVGSID